jgi:hypothetical protein
VLVNAIALLGGIAIVAVILSDVFQSVLVPRAVGRRFRPSFIAWSRLWLLWPWLGWKLYGRNPDRREDFLAFFAPFALVFLLLMWATMLIVGYGLIFFALRSGIAPTIHSLGQAEYFAGTSMLTIGYGDIVPRTSAARVIAIVAGMTGLLLFAVDTAFLFSVIGAFQTRETFVVRLGARSGTPPSGIDLVAVAAYSDTLANLGTLMLDAQTWVAQVMESHLAYPVLAFFRSSHDYESWIGTLGTLLDASVLLMTTVEGVHHGEARVFYTIGRHCTADLARYFRVEQRAEGPGIDRTEFDAACHRLTKAGLKLRDADKAWAEFSVLRATYAANLNAMARLFEIPPLAWIGDRSFVSNPH